jgi:hypothetical protein
MIRSVGYQVEAQIIQQHATVTCAESEAVAPLLLNFALNENERPASRPGLLTPVQRA